ncbi:hypothetical protein [Embleya scabrispora]|uniref:hypothetical protein n=1 Tax=Embleya scabrispora TaxID=159449 RepID=UPI00039E0176|nr:hypothetical protein [Embleya scabrispora]
MPTATVRLVRRTHSARSFTNCRPSTTSSRPGGLRVTDDSPGVTFLPGCRDGLQDRRDRHRLVDDGGLLGFGHGPVSPVAERFGDTVRLTLDAEQSDSPMVELSVTELRHLLAGAERNPADFLTPAAGWASGHLPGHRDPATAALARVPDLPAPAIPPKS